MSTNTIVLVALAGLAVYVVAQRAAASTPPPAPAAAATPLGGAPGFGFNLGFFKTE